MTILLSQSDIIENSISYKGSKGLCHGFALAIFSSLHKGNLDKWNNFFKACTKTPDQQTGIMVDEKFKSMLSR